MNFSDADYEQLRKEIEKAKSYSDLMGKDGVIKKLIKRSLEQVLEAEMKEHLGYEKHSPSGNNSGNSRNGRSIKKLKTDEGEMQIEIPRDRNGEFEPIIVPKHQRLLGDLENKIISMYAKGMSTRDIQTHIEEIYGLKLSAASVSNITDSIIAIVKEWQARPLEEIYPIVFLDAIHFKVREDGKVVSKAAYTCLGVDLQGHKDLLGIWIGEAESSKFWLNILNEMRNRGVKDILIACVDGLKGFVEAIESIFPETIVQKCIIHQIRYSLNYVASKDHKEFMTDLKNVYKAPTKDNAAFELTKLDEKWGKKYPLPLKSWKSNWENLTTYFDFPQEIRTLIYTTNAVEALHRQFRKVTKAKTLFPNDEALTKMLFLAFEGISKKWTTSLQNWSFIISQLSIIFENRIKNYV